MENINKTLIEKLNVNQWKNTEKVIHWFKSIEQKSRCFFIQFYVIEFYPSITEKFLEEVIVFAKQHREIAEKDLGIIKHCRKSLFYQEDEAWKKKDSESCFDVTMGSNDGAEICELTGILFLSQLSNLLPQEDIGLYRDDGLILLGNTNGQITDRIRKNVIKLFKEIGFKIEIETNLKIVNFLDVTFNLANSTYRPYRKPNDNLLYIHTSSNQPPQIIKHLPDSIEERLSNNSSNEQVFNSAKPEYEKALKDSGYKNVNLKYGAQKERRKKNNRNRKIIWFNPPYSKQVSTNIAKRFLNLLDQHFPKQHRLYKIFNRNNVKVSYSCTENMSSFISSHNKKLLNSRTGNIKPCNCRSKDDCPLNGQCHAQDIVYKCTILTSINPNKTNLGAAEENFMKRYSNHTKSFRHKRYSKETTLSKYIW